jgi:ABC-type Mn2+/Zn2+ transport system ATPase subunit
LSTSGHNIIRCSDVTVKHGRVLALQNVTVDIPCGSLTAVAGPNGAGKSTLLRSILGWHPLATGEIRIGDAHPQHVLPRLAYLPQRQLIDWDFPITVREVVEQGRYAALRIGQSMKDLDHDRVNRALAELGLEALAGRQIRMLSGGQQQRVFLARSLAQGADIFLLDEPFIGLDLFATEELTHILLNWRAQGRTVLAAMHDLDLARRHFEQAILLATRLVAFGPVTQALSRENLEQAFHESHCAHQDPLHMVRTAQFPQ